MVILSEPDIIMDITIIIEAITANTDITAKQQVIIQIESLNNLQ